MRNIINIGLSIILLSGCGAEIAYKRGASARDLQVSKAACEKASNEQALEKCLADNGWMVQKLDGSDMTDDELFATASVTDDNRVAKPKTTNNHTVQTTASLEKEKEKIKPAPSTDKPTPAAAPSVAITDNPTPKPTTKPKPSLHDTYVIKSWWKMGGNPTVLESNMHECNSKLGDAHTPNKKTFTFTRGFAICMREKGWRGLIERQ